MTSLGNIAKSSYWQQNVVMVCTPHTAFMRIKIDNKIHLIISGNSVGGIYIVHIILLRV